MRRGLRLACFFSCMLPFTYLSQCHTTTSGFFAPEMFYGRGRERALLSDPDGPCFIFGGRQLGKTALQRDVERTFHHPGDQRVAIWIDLLGHQISRGRPSEDRWIILAEEFRRHGIIPPNVANLTNGDTVLKKLREWLDAQPERRLLLLLDETDEFFVADGYGKDPIVHTGKLKRMMDDMQAAEDWPALLQAESFRGRIFRLDSDGDRQARAVWLEFVRGYAQVSRVLPLDQRTVFLAFVQDDADLCLLAPDLSFVYQCWQGIVQPWDMAAYVASLINEATLSPLERQIHIATVVELSRWDLRMATLLAQLPLRELLTPQNVPLQFARDNCWEVPAVWPERQPFHDAWNEVPCWHTAVVALRGDHDEIARRLWQAQVAVLFSIFGSPAAAVAGETPHTVVAAPSPVRWHHHPSA